MATISIRVAVAVAACVAAIGCGCHPGTLASHPVELHPQETQMWCGAAAGQMVMDYLGHDVSQCKQANDRFESTDCACSQCGATTPVNPACIKGWFPEFKRYGFDSKRKYDEALEWDEVTSELSKNCGNTPFVFSWHWLGGSGHVMVATGYNTVDGVNKIEILNPWTPCDGDAEIITYDEYVERPGDHTHWDDIYAIEYTGT